MRVEKEAGIKHAAPIQLRRSTRLWFHRGGKKKKRGKLKYKFLACSIALPAMCHRPASNRHCNPSRFGAFRPCIALRAHGRAALIQTPDQGLEGRGLEGILRTRVAACLAVRAGAVERESDSSLGARSTGSSRQVPCSSSKASHECATSSCLLTREDPQ